MNKPDAKTVGALRESGVQHVPTFGSQGEYSGHIDMRSGSYYRHDGSYGGFIQLPRR